MVATECSEPFVFGGASVNVVVLPFTYTDDENRDLTQAARNVTGLIGFDIVSTARYGGLGIVRLFGDEASCSLPDVLDRLNQNREGPFGRLQPGGGVAVYWGRFYEDSGSLYVQSFLDFFRFEARPDIPLRLVAGGQAFELSGELPGRIAFSPRQIALEDVKSINERYFEAITLRVAASDSAPRLDGYPIDTPEFAVGVEVVEDGWLKLRSFFGHPDAYLRLDIENSAVLRRVLPELSLLDSIVGYLTYRAANESPESFSFDMPDDMPDLIARSAANYREYIRRDAEPLGFAVSYAVQGATRLLSLGYSGESNHEESKLAERELASAVDLLPTDSRLLNLHAIARLSRCCRETPDFESGKGIEDEFTRAMLLAPESSVAASNLQQFYEFLSLFPDQSLIDPADLKLRLTAIEELAP